MGKLICHCGKLACWGIEKRERCGIHKNIDDINIVNKSKKCREINCTLKPSYGLEKNRRCVVQVIKLKTCGTFQKNNVKFITVY